VKFTDPDRALRFGSDEELRRFHDDLTALLREATITATRTASVDDAPERARAVLRRYATVLRALNALRRTLPHEPGAGEAVSSSTPRRA
jgi:hypothetical protein